MHIFKANELLSCMLQSSHCPWSQLRAVLALLPQCCRRSLAFLSAALSSRHGTATRLSNVLCPAVIIPPRPVPNLGYACLNTTLQLQKPPVTSNRGAILRTFEEKGLPHISQLALQNCKDLLPIVQWNHEHNIRLFRYAQASEHCLSTTFIS